MIPALGYLLAIQVRLFTGVLAHSLQHAKGRLGIRVHGLHRQDQTLLGQRGYAGQGSSLVSLLQHSPMALSEWS
jgi:hypothetical protein